MRGQLRVGSGLSWVTAWLLALAGATLYLLWPGALTWWGGLALVFPVLALAARRASEAGFEGDQSGGGGDGGPWLPPSDSGGGF